MLGFASFDTPSREGLDAVAFGAALTEMFKKIKAAIGDGVPETVLVLGYGDAFLRHTDMPLAPIPDMRAMLAVGTKNFFPENLHGFEFDCCLLQSDGEDAARALKKARVLVGGAKRETLFELRAAARRAGLVVRDITASQVGQARATTTLAEFVEPAWPLAAKASRGTRPGLAEGEAVATLDVGFSHSSICILSGGDIVHSRLVTLGGDKLTRGLAEAMKVSYAAAENVKLVLLDKAGAAPNDVLSSLAGELKGSIDFFESEYGKKVGCIYVSGGSARSARIIQTLQDSIPVPLEPWKIPASLVLAVPEPQQREVQRQAPQLTVAIGAALDFLAPGPLRINFLANEQDAEEERLRDPMRPSIRIAYFLFGIMLIWSLSLFGELMLGKSELRKLKAEVKKSEKSVKEVAESSLDIGEINHRMSALSEHTTNRFLWAVQLNELQKVMVKDIVVTRLALEQTLSNAIPPVTISGDHSVVPERPRTLETMTLTIQAKDFASPWAMGKFIEKINSQAYFQERFRNTPPLTLKNHVARQIDGTDPDRSFSLITLECVFRERVLGYE
jgi:Tfp pilus assembly PilM family ATPase